MISDKEENIDTVVHSLTEEQKNILAIAKKMMIKYVGDKFGDKVNREDFASFLDQIDVEFRQTEFGTDGVYRNLTKRITISTNSSNPFESKKIDVERLATIIHEHAHYISAIKNCQLFF